MYERETNSNDLGNRQKTKFRNYGCQKHRAQLCWGFVALAAQKTILSVVEVTIPEPNQI